MAPYTSDVLQNITPMLELQPSGPFGVLVLLGGAAYRMRVLPFRSQWQMDLEIGNGFHKEVMI